MPSFRCENPALEKVLSELLTLIIEHGGYVSDNITLMEEKGELRILSDLPEENNDVLIILTDACLPRIEEFMITVQGDELIAIAKSSDVEESHIAAMGLMMNIYNITNKLAKHRETSPWLALKKSPEIMGKLYEARFEAPKIKQYYEQYESMEYNGLLIDTFLGSRTLAVNPNGGGDSYRCLMPFIDFLNHFHASSGYQITNDKLPALLIRNSVPIVGSQECFVRYTLMDAMDSFLTYGFVDSNAPFVRSVPLRFDLHELSSVQVYAQILQPFKGDLPGPVKDLRAYIPQVLEGDDSVMRLSHLLIPGANAPLALRRVLAFYIRGWKPGLNLAAVKKIIINAEKLIIRENLDYYTSLSSAIENIGEGNAPPGIMGSIKILIDSQLSKLHQYQERIQNVGDWDRILGSKPRLF